MSNYRGRTVAALASLAAMAGCIGALAFTPHPAGEAPAKPSVPFCKVDREVPDYLTVTGPEGGRITVDGVDGGRLTLVDDEVADDAGIYSGIRYNVPGPGDVRVNDVECAG